MEYVINSTNGSLKGGHVANVANIELYLAGNHWNYHLTLLQYVALLLLVAGKVADYTDVSADETIERNSVK